MLGQWVEAFTIKSGIPIGFPGLTGRGKQLTPASCPLTSVCGLWHVYAPSPSKLIKI